MSLMDPTEEEFGPILRALYHATGDVPSIVLREQSGLKPAFFSELMHMLVEIEAVGLVADVFAESGHAVSYRLTREMREQLDRNRITPEN